MRWSISTHAIIITLGPVGNTHVWSKGGTLKFSFWDQTEQYFPPFFLWMIHGWITSSILGAGSLVPLLYEVLFFSYSQSNCKKGPDSDRDGFTLLMKELSFAFKPRHLSLSAIVSPSQNIIDQGRWCYVYTIIYNTPWNRTIVIQGSYLTAATPRHLWETRLFTNLGKYTPI